MFRVLIVSTILVLCFVAIMPFAADIGHYFAAWYRSLRRPVPGTGEKTEDKPTQAG